MTVDAVDNDVASEGREEMEDSIDAVSSLGGKTRCSMGVAACNAASEAAHNMREQTEKRTDERGTYVQCDARKKMSIPFAANGSVLSEPGGDMGGSGGDGET